MKKERKLEEIRSFRTSKGQKKKERKKRRKRKMLKLRIVFYVTKNSIEKQSKQMAIETERKHLVEF